MAALALPALIAAFVTTPATAVGRDRSEAADWHYDVSAGAGCRELRIEARFVVVPEGSLTIDQGLGPYVLEPELLDARGARIERDGDHFVASGCARRPCRIRYRFRLADAAGELRDRSRAFSQDAVLLAPPSSWLLRPSEPRGAAGWRMRIRTPDECRFVTGVLPSSDGEPGSYEAAPGDLPQSPYSAFGPFETLRIDVPGGFVDVAVAPGERSASRDDLRGWVEGSARAVAGYYGRFPVPRALVMVLPGSRRAVGFGTTLGNGGASIMIWVGRSATAADLAHDWVLTHEMVHLGLPNLPLRHRWLEEGLATYLEPIARARLGALRSDTVWEGLARGLPNGLPQPGDQGLDRTHTWGRTYWGGALFSFVADLEIRERTGNRRSLDDALRGVLAAGGNIAVRWPLERLLREADRAAGVPVLSRLHAAWATTPVDVDLDSLWRRLGVALVDGTVRFDDAAPLAGIRRSITAPNSDR